MEISAVGQLERALPVPDLGGDDEANGHWLVNVTRRQRMRQDPDGVRVWYCQDCNKPNMSVGSEYSREIIRYKIEGVNRQGVEQSHKREREIKGWWLQTGNKETKRGQSRDLT